MKKFINKPSDIFKYYRLKNNVKYPGWIAMAKVRETARINKCSDDNAAEILLHNGYFRRLEPREIDYTNYNSLNEYFHAAKGRVPLVMIHGIQKLRDENNYDFQTAYKILLDAKVIIEIN